MPCWNFSIGPTVIHIHKDFKEFLQLLNANKVEYLIVGAYAVAYHARPRYTGDLDVFIRATEENGECVAKTLRDFGFASLGITGADFARPNHVVQLGYEPVRIDISSGITAVDFEEAWNEKCSGTLDGIPVYFLGKRHLIENKSAVRRDKDIVDLENLRKMKDKK